MENLDLANYLAKARWGSTRLSSAKYSGAWGYWATNSRKSSCWHTSKNTTIIVLRLVACYKLMGVEKTVKEVFKMLLSAELDIYVHRLMTTSFLRPVASPQEVYKLYISIDIISTRIYFGMWILKFFMLHDRNVKRERGKRFRMDWRKWGKKGT